jgi:hypothetical protein
MAALFPIVLSLAVFRMGHAVATADSSLSWAHRSESCRTDCLWSHLGLAPLAILVAAVFGPCSEISRLVLSTLDGLPGGNGRYVPSLSFLM